MSFIKSILEIINIYKKMFWVASVKNRIMKIILNEEFLKTNLLHSVEYEDKGSEHEKMILLIFREKKYKDLIMSDIQIGKIQGKMLTFCPSNNLHLDI